MDGMWEVFKCVVCLGRLRDARMCPACSKVPAVLLCVCVSVCAAFTSLCCAQMCCGPCIQRWLDETPECPHCRHHVTYANLVNCRWADDVVARLDDLGHVVASVSGSAHTLSPSRSEPDTHCSVHNNVLDVYCTTCGTCVCHSCALWGDHRGHTHQDIDFKYNDAVAQISAKVTNLRARQDELLASMQGEQSSNYSHRFIHSDNVSIDFARNGFCCFWSSLCFASN